MKFHGNLSGFSMRAEIMRRVVTSLHIANAPKIKDAYQIVTLHLSYVRCFVLSFLRSHGLCSLRYLDSHVIHVF
jgi:hypothetical protein